VRAASLPTDKQAAKAIVPRVRALHDPAACLAAYLAEQRLLTTPSDVRTNSTQADRRRDVRVVVAFVETKVDRASRPTWATHDDSNKHFADHRGVGHVRSANERGERHAATIRQDMPFYAAFRAVRRVRPREVPPFGAFTEALSSELHFHAMPRRPS
jgi:hypothetical protein